MDDLTQCREQVDDARGLFVALRGKGQYHMVSGDVTLAVRAVSSRWPIV